jgi:glycine C-acetyltransferase
MSPSLVERLSLELAALKEQGLYKPERIIDSPQQAAVSMQGGREVINFCANNYLGLANHPAIVAAALTQALDRVGLRPVLGAVHLRHSDDPQVELEQRIAGVPPDSRTRSSTPPASTPTAGLFETHPRRRGRGHQRHAEPRLDHRRHPPVQGASRYRYLEQRTWPTCEARS